MGEAFRIIQHAYNPEMVKSATSCYRIAPPKSYGRGSACAIEFRDL